MLPMAGRITEAMQFRFLHIKQYDLPYTWRIEERQLENAVIWLIEDGTFEMESDGETIRGVAGDLFCLAPGTRLNCCAKTARLRILSLNYETVVPMDSSNRWPVSLRFPLRCKQNTEELAELLRTMLADAAVDRAGRPFLLQAGLLRLLGLMAVDRAEPEADHRDIRVRKAIAHMTRRPDAVWTVQQLAEAVHTSEPHLRKLFLRDTGLPPLQYWHQWKATLAMRRLATSNERVSAIGYELGYEDANYFARMFKKVVGISPQEYRRKHQDWMQVELEK